MTLCFTPVLAPPRASSLAPRHAACRPRSAPPRPSKPRNYWSDRRNLALELQAFAQQQHMSFTMPTAAQLLAAGRIDLLRAVQRHGGFATIASSAGLIPVRRHRGFDHLSYVRAQLLPLFRARVLTPGVMPSASQLRLIRRADLLPCIAAAGGFSAVAAKLRLLPARTRRRRLTAAREPSLPTRRKRRRRHYWHLWSNFESELRAFAHQSCDGHMPLQRHLIDAKRTDLLNALRIHGGTASVARRMGLPPAPATKSKRPHSYWKDPAVLNAQLLTFTARNGYHELMPTRRQLRDAGRMDLVYAVEKHGGYAKIASSLHLMWHGPCSYWRVFRNLEKRLLDYMRRKGLKDVMPLLKTLYDDGRMDLVYGIARHGGMMKVATRIGATVQFPHRKPNYWEHPSHLQREVEDFLRTQPLAARRYMPTSVALVQAGRADLATAIRDRGGWVYYAQRLGLRFDFEIRPQGFWQCEANVLRELKNYVMHRYGSWEHPGKQPAQDEERSPEQQFLYIPSTDMLKRDGRSDIAFAIERYHGGNSAFALRNGFEVAEDVVSILLAEEWMRWNRFAPALRSWIRNHGSNGIIPTKQDLIKTGRHDLRFATYSHGGTRIIARRMQLVLAEDSLDVWLPAWLGIQAAKLGLLINMMGDDHRPGEGSKIALKYERDLASAVVGQCTRMMTTTVKRMVYGRMTSSSIRGIRKPRKRVGVGKDGGWQSATRGSDRLSAEELAKLRMRYRHLSPDDIIAV